MKRILLPLALAAAITVPVGAQFGWFTLNGGLIARMSSAVAAVTIEQAGSGPILSLIRRGIGVTSTDGGRLSNTTAAAAGAQQYSPRSCWEGQGWKTDATAASQSVVFCMETQPVQGSSAPSGNFVLKASINGGAFSTVGTFTSGGNFTAAGTVTGTIFNSTATTVVLGTAENPYTITLADWGTALSAEGVPVANSGLLYLGASKIGRLVITGSGNELGQFQLNGTGNSTSASTDNNSTTSATKDTASRINVYYDAAGASGAGYYIQNLRGGTVTIRALLIGA
jgi:hypothetical protein